MHEYSQALLLRVPKPALVVFAWTSLVITSVVLLTNECHADMWSKGANAIKDGGKSIEQAARDAAEEARKARDRARKEAERIARQAEERLRQAKRDADNAALALKEKQNEVIRAFNDLKDKQAEAIRNATTEALNAAAEAEKAAKQTAEELGAIAAQSKQATATLIRSRDDAMRLRDQARKRLKALEKAAREDAERLADAGIAAPSRFARSVEKESSRLDDSARSVALKAVVKIREDHEKLANSSGTELARAREHLQSIKNERDIVEALQESPHPFNPDLYERLTKATKVEVDNANKGRKLLLDEIKKLPQDVRDRLETLSKSAQTESSRLVEEIKNSSIFQLLVKEALTLLMEDPGELPIFGLDYHGDPVIYVNGIYTTEAAASEVAIAIAIKLQRPVMLLYNPSAINPPAFSTGTSGITEDLEEAVYDRTWPAHLAKDLALLIDIPRQKNISTRKLTWLIYNSQKPLSIVSQSQGCIQVRNALFATALVGKESTVRNKVAWVACGAPINDKEIWPMPAKYRRLRHKDDLVETVIGMGGTHKGKWPNIPQHFDQHYINLLEPEMFWPNTALYESQEIVATTENDKKRRVEEEKAEQARKALEAAEAELRAINEKLKNSLELSPEELAKLEKEQRVANARVLAAEEESEAKRLEIEAINLENRAITADTEAYRAEAFAEERTYEASYLDSQATALEAEAFRARNDDSFESLLKIAEEARSRAGEVRAEAEKETQLASSKREIAVELQQVAATAKSSSRLVKARIDLGKKSASMKTNALVAANSLKEKNLQLVEFRALVFKSRIDAMSKEEVDSFLASAPKDIEILRTQFNSKKDELKLLLTGIEAIKAEARSLRAEARISVNLSTRSEIELDAVAKTIEASEAVSKSEQLLAEISLLEAKAKQKEELLEAIKAAHP